LTTPHQWFRPANPERGHELYRRACSYGEDWWYLCVEVSASRAGVVLGWAFLEGIPNDAGSPKDYFAQIALDLGSKAICEALQDRERDMERCKTASG
jgi:hypothetical protein